MRTESRGAHTRDDFVDSDPEWGKVNLIVSKSPQGIELNKKPLPEMPAELKKLLET